MRIYLGGNSFPREVLTAPPHGRFDWYPLVSFYDVERRYAKFILENNKRYPGFIMDSGAFSLLGSQKHKTKGVNWDEYVERYADVVNKYEIDNFIELDLDAIIGIKEVERLRAKLERLTGRQCMPVWHKSRGWDYWLRMVQEYKYVCIGGIAAWDITPAEIGIFRPLLAEAKKNDCKVHGLGFTNTTKLAQFPFYSVDSSSWNSGARWGRLPKFVDGKIITIDPPKGKRLASSGEKCHRLVVYSFNEWLKYCYYMDNGSR